MCESCEGAEVAMLFCAQDVNDMCRTMSSFFGLIFLGGPPPPLSRLSLRVGSFQL